MVDFHLQLKQIQYVEINKLYSPTYAFRCVLADYEIKWTFPPPPIHIAYKLLLLTVDVPD